MSKTQGHGELIKFDPKRGIYIVHDHDDFYQKYIYNNVLGLICFTRDVESVLQVLQVYLIEDSKVARTYLTMPTVSLGYLQSIFRGYTMFVMFGTVRDCSGRYLGQC